MFLKTIQFVLRWCCLEKNWFQYILMCGLKIDLLIVVWGKHLNKIRCNHKNWINLLTNQSVLSSAQVFVTFYLRTRKFFIFFCFVAKIQIMLLFSLHTLVVLYILLSQLVSDVHP